MKTNIEITVENKGIANGTLGWFNKILNESTLVIANTKSGDPAIWLKCLDKSNKIALTLICTTISRNGYDDIHYNIIDD